MRVVAMIAKASLTHVVELRTLHPALATLKAEEHAGPNSAATSGRGTVYKELRLLN